MFLKKMLFGSFVICLLLSCGDKGDCVNTAEFTVPQLNPANAEGWESYSIPVVLNKDNVEGLSPGTGSPEAAVVHFYASKIRKDSCFNQVLPTDREKYRIDPILERMKDWIFLEAKLTERKKRGSDRYWIRVHMKIEIKGKINSDYDEATVRQIDGQWYVIRPPV